MKLVKCAFGFSLGSPWNCILWSICNVTSFSSKLFACMGGQCIVDWTTVGGKENSSSSICQAVERVWWPDFYSFVHFVPPVVHPRHEYVSRLLDVA